MASGLVVAVLTMATATGAFFAGRVSFRSAILMNAKAEALSWENLYKSLKEKNEFLEQQIKELTAEGHSKDLKIAELTGKIDVIVKFMQNVMGKEMMFESTSKTTVN